MLTGPVLGKRRNHSEEATVFACGGNLMRKLILTGVVALAVELGILVGTASAWWPCGLPPLPTRFEERTITYYRPELKTEYREVQRTVSRCVPETHEQEIQE